MRIGKVVTTALVGLLACFVAPVAASANPNQIPAGRVTRLWSGAWPYLPAPKGDARIRGYGFVATVTGDECAPSIGEAPEAVTAVPGDMVCAFSLSFADELANWANLANQHVPGLSATVSDGAVHAPITATDLYTAAASEFAISVPIGSDPVLSISEAGFSQSYSLTEKRRPAPSPPVLYRSPGFWEERSFPDTKAVLPEIGVLDRHGATEQLTLSEADLTYFRPDDPAIRPPSTSDAFLVVSFGDAEEPGPSGDSFGGFRPLGASKVRLRLPGGRIEDSIPINEALSGLLPATYVFVVPEGFSKGAVIIAPGVTDGTETSPAGRYLKTEPVAFGTVTIPIGGGDATSTPAIVGARTADPPAKARHTPRSARGAGGIPAGVPIGGGATVVFVAILIPIWRRRHGRRIVMVFPAPVPAGAGDGDANIVGAEPAETQAPPGGEAAQPGDEPAGTPATAPQEKPPPVRLAVKVLGEVEVDPDVGASGRQALVVLVVYLVLNAGREVSSPDLCQALSIKAGTLANYAWRLREALGSEVLASKRRSAKYSYVGEVTSDWASFGDLTRRARVASGDERLELLQAALGLVRGQPFAGNARYDWADEVAREMQGEIRRAALEASGLLWERERSGAAVTGSARAAVAVGLMVDPEDYLLHRRRLETSAGDVDAIVEAWADTKRLGKRAADLRRLRDRLIGMATFEKGGEGTGS